jgi:hypothetical protein
MHKRPQKIQKSPKLIQKYSQKYQKITNLTKLSLKHFCGTFLHIFLGGGGSFVLFGGGGVGFLTFFEGILGKVERLKS